MTSDRSTFLLDAFPSLRVAVLGDFLLDEYLIGSTSRVSREAPIVVIDYQETVHHPGGAANAAQNIAAAGGRAVAIGVRGADREGEALATLLQERGVETSSLVESRELATPLKLRIMAGEMNAQKQQVARVDRSGRFTPTAALRDRLAGSVEAAVADCHAMLISDYGIGLLKSDLGATAIAACRGRGLPVVIDSRFALTRFPGATVATPNEVEALEAIGVRSGAEVTSEELASRLFDVSGIERFIVTRGSKGMLVCEPGGVETPIGIVGSNEATDVTGAGDTVSAFVAMSLGAGATVVEAARMATYAAAVVVMKRGTAVASPDEVRAVIDRHPMS